MRNPPRIRAKPPDQGEMLELVATIKHLASLSDQARKAMLATFSPDRWAQCQDLNILSPSSLIVPATVLASAFPPKSRSMFLTTTCRNTSGHRT